MSKENNSIISALCWIKRGHAAPMLQEYEPSENELKSHQKMQKKLAKGADINDMEIGQAVKVLENNMDMQNEQEDDDGFEDVDSGEEI